MLTAEIRGFVDLCKKTNFSTQDAVDQGILADTLCWFYIFQPLLREVPELAKFLQLHKCYLQIRDYNDKLKSCEQELQVSLFFHCCVGNAELQRVLFPAY